MRVDNVSEVNLLCIQKAVDEFNVPYGFGRLPCKIESRFANFKAEQWKNWILIYSIVCFRSVLSQPLYSLWLVFVEACFLLCSHVITSNGIALADELIHKYCCLFQERFGREEYYPNLHMHCHLKDCFIDFGPAPSFWLFPFERMNGFLGSFHTNNISVESQVFRKFVVTQQAYSAVWPKSELTDIVKPLLNQDISEDTTLLGGLYVHIIHPFDIQAILEANNHCKLLPAVKQKAFNPKDLQQINSCLSSILREKYKLTFLLHQESKSVVFNNDRYGCFSSRKKKVYLLLSRTRPIHKKEFNFHVFLVKVVNCTVELEIELNAATISELVLCKFIPLQPSLHRHYYAKPVEVWKLPDTEIQECNNAIFLPISCILCQCAYSKFINDNSCITVVPCNRLAGII